MISLIITLVILGFALYLIETYVPMAPPFKLIIRFIVILISFLLLLQFFGVFRFPAVSR